MHIICFVSIMTSSRWSTQNDLNDIFVNFLSHLVLFGDFFNTGILLVYYSFQFFASLGFWVCVCVYVGGSCDFYSF